MKHTFRVAAQNFGDWIRWPGVAWTEWHFERVSSSGIDHGAERVLSEVIDWLCRAQDNSASADGGVAREYSLTHGWATSYPETTGYIIPTLLAYADRSGRRDLVDRARRMADWLVSIQLAQGGFQGARLIPVPLFR
jgi:hypothetical protein